MVKQDDEIFINKSNFTYFICQKINTDFNVLYKQILFGKYVVCLSMNTEFLFFSIGCRWIGIIGFCVSTIGVKQKNIPYYILKHSKTIDDVVCHEHKLAGKYVLLYVENYTLYVIGDATCSIQVNYSTTDLLAISSSLKLIADFCGFKPSKKYTNIREFSDISQAMPYNSTVYDTVKVLLPSQFLDAKKKRTFQIKSDHCKKNSLSPFDAAKITSKTIDVITKEYSKKYQLVCPLTGGKDSRVVLAFLKKNVDNLECYTIKHLTHTYKEQDVVLPKIITQELRVRYKLLHDTKVPPKFCLFLNQLYGSKFYSKFTLMLAYLIRVNFNEKAIVNGDIIGQIGKSSVHRDLPEYWVNASYLACKLHNYHVQSKKELQLWWKEISSNTKYISAYDFFSWDMRLGRWAAQENQIYDLLGVTYLNIFNCRDVIYVWTQVNRTNRTNSEIHKNILKLINPELLRFPFKAEKNVMIRLVKLTKPTFFIFSYVKFIFQKAVFKYHQVKSSK